MDICSGFHQSGYMITKWIYVVDILYQSGYQGGYMQWICSGFHQSFQKICGLLCGLKHHIVKITDYVSLKEHGNVNGEELLTKLSEDLAQL